MATHFARGILTEGHLVSARLPSPCHIEARDLPAHRRTRFLASRSLLAELMFMLYGTSTLPEIVTEAKGKPVFRDKNLPGFSISYAGNIVGVVLTTEGTCGLDMELQRATRGFNNQIQRKRGASPVTKTCGSIIKTTPMKHARSSLHCARAYSNSPAMYAMTIRANSSFYPAQDA